MELRHSINVVNKFLGLHRSSSNHRDLIENIVKDALLTIIDNFDVSKRIEVKEIDEEGEENKQRFGRSF